MVRRWFVGSTAVAPLLLMGALGLRAQGGTALTGVVTSSQEGTMEGPWLQPEPTGRSALIEIRLGGTYVIVTTPDVRAR